jgi:translation initiation factor IF-2
VDHGKTSLLDAIRSARVVAGEDGGITQHMGAYHLETSHGAVTFLDTPGHEAFTAMRARGAELTDVVVLVVAADDGLMPQTLEAINHAKAAEVPIVVALNKIDLGDQNKIKIYGQLAEHGLTPSGDWGGEVDVIETSAITGLGVQDLVDHLADLSSLLDFKADATLPAMGSVIEAETKSGVGAVVRVLVQEGTLHVGDFIVCGPAFGKVRALSDDRGNRIQSAGPSIPVEVWGLDEVPTAGDRLYALESLQRAKEIATETKQTRVERSRIQSRKVKTLEEMVLQKGSDEIPELNVIIKADVDGSVAALKHSLGSLPSDEVRLAVRHAGVGAVNDGDILLASACGGIVIAFRVDSSVKVRRLAEQHGVDVRPYRVIYDARDDIKKALEGLLEPEEKIESRGSVEVRQIFHMGKKIGMIAGSFVVSGTIERSQFGKIVRDGVIVRDRCKFASLRRFKDDVREVRAGLECGIRLEGFDDLHVGDVIETYNVLKVARTL